MYKNYRYINAGENEIHRYGKKARAIVASHLEANEAGYYSIPADGGKYYTLGTSNGKFGEFIKYDGTFFSVNKGGYAYAKAGTEKGEAFVKMLQSLIDEMIEIDSERIENYRELHADEYDEEELEEAINVPANYNEVLIHVPQELKAEKVEALDELKDE